MTRKISLIIGIAVAALTVALPTAFGEGRLAGSQEPDAVAFFQANEMATFGRQSVEPGWLKALRIRGEGMQRLYGGESTTVSLSGYREAGERAVPMETLDHRGGDLGKVAEVLS